MGWALNRHRSKPISCNEWGFTDRSMCGSVRAMPAGGWTVRLPKRLLPGCFRATVERLDPSAPNTPERDPDPALKVRGGEEFILAVPEPEPAHNEAQDIPLRIVFEDEHLLVVDKPAGLVVHPAAGNRDGTLVNALLHHCGDSLSGIGGVARPEILCTGSTRTRRGCWSSPRPMSRTRALHWQFAAHSIDRRYLAIVSGVPKVSEEMVDAPLARSATNRKKIAIVEVPRQARGNPLEALAGFRRCGPGGMPFGDGTDPPGSRAHGIAGPRTAWRSCLDGGSAKSHRKLLSELHFHRQALHAAELGFTHPITKRRLSFASGMPPDMQELFTALGV